MTETYQGHANRETWAFNLHWTNDQGLYNETLNQAEMYLTDTYGSDWRSLPADELTAAEYGVGEHVVAHWKEYVEDYEDEMGTQAGPELSMFYRAVGSWWRIDHAEVGAAVRESLENEN